MTLRKKGHFALCTSHWIPCWVVKKKKMAKRKYLRRHRNKKGPNSGKKSSFFNLDLIKSNGRVLVAFLMFGAESRICSFEKEILFFFRFFSTTTLTVACFLYFSWGAWLLLLGRKQTIVDVCAVLSIMFVKSNFFCLCIKRPLFSLQLRCGLFSLAKLQE